MILWWRSKWVVLWSLWAARVVRQPTPPVLTSSGWVAGSIANAGTHKEYLGIPYATVVQRFQAPGPEPTWDGIFEAMNENIRCRQAFVLNAPHTSGTEDCLVLNVYTPLNALPTDRLPVMFFVHGGGFFENSGSRMIYGPEFLTTKDVILVSINYRLNIQGYGCLGIKEAPGNAGMKDQVAALKWVRRNIRAFGGDPDNVTLFGESAGGASVSFHVLSPMSKGLFHKAITQSGSSLGAWAFQYKPVYLASLLAKTMGFVSMDPHTLYKYFMTKSDSDLVVTRVPRQEGNTLISEILYAPCAETIIEGEEPFLTALPYELLSQGNYNKVPMIIGTNIEEGLLFASMEESNLIESMAFEKMFPKDLTFPSNEIRRLEAEKIKKMYFNEEEISLNNKAKLSKIHGEPYFRYPALEETELLAQTNDQPIFSYVFSYDGIRNLPKYGLTGDLRSVRGASHADDLFYLFRQSVLPVLFEWDMIEKMSTMWTNFAKYGDPTPTTSELLPVKWPAVTKEDKRSFVIDEQFTTVPLWESQTLRHWKDVYSKYRRKL